MARSPQRGRPDNRPVAVIDIGSNSIRLVVFDGLKRAPLPVFNEKATCELGRGLERDGKLAEPAMDRATASIRRFAGIARAMGVRSPALLGTAAVRDAANGRAFAQRIREATGLTVGIVSGGDEARLSALGVVSGIPEATGIVGDLGGGSLELIALDKGAVGQHATLPIGPLRLMDLAEDADAPKVREAVDRHLAGAGWLAERQRGTFYAVGGAWRALARLHMAQSDYPLRIIHHYRLSRDEAEELSDLVAHLGKQTLRRIVAVSRSRLAGLPWAALVLQRVLRVAKPTEIVFSANGLREGYLYNLLDPVERRRDPLLAACREHMHGRGRGGMGGEALFRWSAPLFADETREQARLRHAACLLADVGWRAHPEFRAEAAFHEVLRLPYASLSHEERAWLALAVLSRYGASIEAAFARPAVAVIEEDALATARRVGLALRLAFAQSAGLPAMLAPSRLVLAPKTLRLEVPRDEIGLLGDVVSRRLAALAEAFGREGTIAATGSIGGSRRAPRATSRPRHR